MFVCGKDENKQKYAEEGPFKTSLITYWNELHHLSKLSREWHLWVTES